MSQDRDRIAAAVKRVLREDTYEGFVWDAIADAVVAEMQSLEGDDLDALTPHERRLLLNLIADPLQGDLS